MLQVVPLLLLLFPLGTWAGQGHQVGQGLSCSGKKWGKAGVGWGHQGNSGLGMWAGQEGQEGLQQSKKPDEGMRMVEKDKVQGTRGNGGSTGLKLWISRAVLEEW